MNKLITGKDLLRQLKADLIGKDSYRGVTLTYSWLANQFGHFSLGFIPTLILYILRLKYFNNSAANWSAIIVSIFWLLFEACNFLIPLLLNNHSTSKFPSKTNRIYVFQPHWKNIAFDTLTDLFFFWLGATLASLLLSYSFEALIILLVLIVLSAYSGYYWYLTKMYLQIPRYPFQFRLSQWHANIYEEDKKTVHRFLDNTSMGMHLFVFGSKRSGKTSLSVGIATELSIKHKASVYTTAMKLYSMFFESNDELYKDNLWAWRKSSILVIDDINPGDPIKEDIVSPKTFLNLLDTYSGNEENREVMKNINVIWVLGNEDPEKILLGKWKDMLEEIGIERKRILSISLPPNNLSIMMEKQPLKQI